ncbi:hypothetical protein LPJ58_005097 [Coemansia sp. RSA 1591]|nr:hypothetical protein LPJ58_005097 [Coemansia sp. RSA 1591]KAJ1755535.1 hypothetical protein LPJ69_005068 [Coemansia sp. RSA 1752]KAJ1782728.1 hypothetical protein LPJ67_004987 [Coemansia sp. RSA 1938]
MVEFNTLAQSDQLDLVMLEERLAHMEKQLDHLFAMHKAKQAAQAMKSPHAGLRELLASGPAVPHIASVLDCDPDLAGFRPYVISEEYLTPDLHLPIEYTDSFTKKTMSRKATNEYISHLAMFTAMLRVYVCRLERNEPIECYKQCLVDMLSIVSKQTLPRVDKYQIWALYGKKAADYVVRSKE